MVNLLRVRRNIILAWRVGNDRDVIVGAEPRTVLLIRADRDVKALTVRAKYLGRPPAGTLIEGQLVTQPWPTGGRTLRPEGEAWVRGRQDLPAVDCVALEHDDASNAHLQPDDGSAWAFWTFVGRITIPRGKTLGVVIRSSVPLPCRVTVGGVEG